MATPSPTLAQPGDWTLGLLANNVWSYAGADDREDVNKGLIQYFIVYSILIHRGRQVRRKQTG